MGVRSGLQKDQSSICGEFWVRACEPAGPSCICMQLETFGPNERVTLGARTAVAAAGFSTLCDIISCGSGSQRTFPNCISTFRCLRCFRTPSGFIVSFFFSSFFQRDVTLARPGKDHPSTNLLPIKLFTSDTDRPALRKTASYTGSHFPNTESVQLAAWAQERNYWNCFFCCSATWATVF